MNGAAFAAIKFDSNLIASTLASVRLAKSDDARLAWRLSKRRSKQALNSIHK